MVDLNKPIERARATAKKSSKVGGFGTRPAGVVVVVTNRLRKYGKP